MKKKLIISILFMVLIASVIYVFVNKKKNTATEPENESNISKAVSTTEKEEINNSSINSSSKEEKSEPVQKIIIELKDVDGKQTNYTFEYKGEIYNAIYRNGCWKIINSYKIQNTNVMNAICEELIKIHPVLGKDRKSYRTVGDMVYEWIQHNLAYAMLSNESKFKESAKDVDLDPDDQGKNFMEIYEDRTGNKFNINDIISTN